MKNLNIQLRILWIKITHWEYWPSYVLYLPVLPYLLFLWIKARSVFFFNTSNPGIRYGGFLMESKWEMYQHAPEGFFPACMLFHSSEPVSSVENHVITGFNLPVIAKPDIGSRGRGVTVITDLHQLRNYHANCLVPYLIQEKIEYPMEAGIFYVRMPGEKNGRITGIVQKEFIKVVGNGKDTLEALLIKQPRYLLQLASLKKVLGNHALKGILQEGESRTVIDIGNHARGAKFINASAQITQKLTTTIDAICKQYKGFYFGRLDIRFKSFEALEQGEDFAIIELNGAGSEPTHIYDPSGSIVFAWKEVCRHWKMLCDISRYNHTKHNLSYLNWQEGIDMFRMNNAHSKKLATSTFKPATKANRFKRIEQAVSLS